MTEKQKPRWPNSAKFFVSALGVVTAMLLLGAAIVQYNSAQVSAARDSADSTVRSQSAAIAGLQRTVNGLQDQLKSHPATHQPPTLAASPSASPSTTEGPPSADAEQTSEYLSDLDANNESPYIAYPQQVDGQAYGHSIYASFGGCETDSIGSYDLGRKWNTLTATVGLSETSEANSVVEFVAYADGRQIFDSGKLTTLKTKRVSVSVNGALTLKLESLFLAGDMGICSEPGNAVWGNAMLSN